MTCKENENLHRNEQEGEGYVFGQPQIERHDLDAVACQLKALLPPEEQKIIDKCLNIYQKNEFHIIIAGEISVGKSSFMNAIMGKRILLTDQTETTAAITYIRSADSVPGVKPDHAKVTFLDGRVEWISINEQERLKDVTTSLDGNQEAIKTVKSVEIYLSKETLFLPPGLTIIDTPGLNGSVSHSDLTHREMGLCHAALFLLDATKFGSLSNKREFQKLYEYAPEVLFVITMWDRAKKSCSDSLQEMKRKKYFPTLGNWLNHGIMNDSNIFVISSLEAMEARKAYLKLPEEARKNCTPSELLPEPDNNEFFALESRLFDIMSSTRAKQLIYKRPIQTMLFLAREALEKIERKLDNDFDGKIDRQLLAERQRIENQQDQLEKIYAELRQFAEHLAQYEIEQYLSIINKNGQAVMDAVNEKLATLAPAAILSSLTTESIERLFEDRLKTLIQLPIEERFKIFLSYLQNLLKAQTSLPQNNRISLETKNSLLDAFDIIVEEEKRMRETIHSLKSEEEALNKKVKDAEHQIERNQLKILDIDLQYSDIETLKKQKESIQHSIAALGPRPQVRIWQEIEEYDDYVEGGILRKVGSWFAICEEYKTVTRHRAITYHDDSERVAWDKKIDELEDKETQVQRRIEELKSSVPSKATAVTENTRLLQVINQTKNELQELRERKKKQLMSLRQYNDLEKKQRAIALWQQEMEATFSRYVDTIANLKGTVNRLLDSFWSNRQFAVKQYVRLLSTYEKTLQQKKIQQNSTYQRLKEEKSKLEKITEKLNRKLLETT